MYPTHYWPRQIHWNSSSSFWLT